MRSNLKLRTRSHPLTRGRAAAIVIASLTLAGAVTATRTNAAGTTTPPASTCPTGGLAFTSTLTNGSMKIGRSASVSGSSGTTCGQISAAADGTLMATATKQNVKFAPTQTTVLILKLPTTVAAVGDLSGPVSIGADGQHVALTGPVEATASVLGAKCVIAITPTLTTDTSGKLKGVPLKDDGTGTLKGKLVANDFAVPAVKATRDCPSFIAGLNNLLLGLPLGKGQSSITFDVALKLGA